MSPVAVNDTLIIPAFDLAVQENGAYTVQRVKWSQSRRERVEVYYLIKAKNTKDDSDVLFFIQADWYNNEHKNDARHLEKVGQGTQYITVTIDKRFQYGQKDSSGEKRFVVYHDMSRKPFQHRFLVTSTLQNAGGKFATDMLREYAGDKITGGILTGAENIAGEYLHTF